MDELEVNVVGDANKNQEQSQRVVVTFQEPSLRDFFQPTKEDTEVCNIRPSKLETHFEMVRLATNILLVDPNEEKPDEETLELRSSAAKCWSEQLLAAIRIAKEMEKLEKSPIEEVRRVVNNLGAVRELEKVFDIYDTESFFWGSTEESSQECLEGIKLLVSREVNHELPLVSLACQHIQSWLEATEGQSAYRAHYLAYWALQEAQVVPFTTILDENGDEKSYNQLFHEVMLWSVGGDGAMEPKHYNKISVALHFLRNSAGAQEAAEQGIKLSQTRQERLELKFQKAHVLFSRWKDETSDKELLEAALKALNDAEREVPDTWDILDDNLRNLLNLMYQMKAKLETFDSRDEIRTQAIQSMTKAVKAKPRGFYVYWFGKMVIRYGENRMWKHILDLLKLLKNPLSDWCPRVGSRYVHRAAKALGEEEVVRQLYIEAVRQPDPDGNDVAQTRLLWASFERFIMARRDDKALEKSKELLWANIYSKLTSNSRVRNSAARLADMLLQDFLTSDTLEVKQQAYDELSKIQAKLESREGFHFNRSLSKTSISLLIMRRRLGTAREFYNEGIAILRTCVQVLSDRRAGNDSTGLWQLAKVLALLPGCTKEAQTALACIYYNVTPEQGSSSTEPLNSRYCDFCHRDIEGIEQGCKIYSCVYCSEIDLCEKCYTLRQIWYGGRHEGGQRGPRVMEDINSYVEVCPEGHHYLEVPPDGWKGFSDGKIKIGDREEEFSTWRDALEEKWKRAWEKGIYNADRMADDHLSHSPMAPIRQISSRTSFEL
jgi:hypothetical protein